MKKVLSLVITLAVILLLATANVAKADGDTPPMRLRVGITRLTLWSRPSNKSAPVKDEVTGKSVKLYCGDVVYEMQNADCGEFLYVHDQYGHEGYVFKKYLVYGYKILLGDVLQDIFRTEWGATYSDAGIGSAIASRRNEELIVIGESQHTMQVITMSDPAAVSGYIPSYAYFEYVYEVGD